MFRLLLLASALRVPFCTSALGVADSESYATRNFCVFPAFCVEQKAFCVFSLCSYRYYDLNL